MLYKSHTWSSIFWGPLAALPSGYSFALDLLMGTAHSQAWTAACLDSGYHGYRSPDCSIPVLLSILMGGFKFHIAHGEQWAGNAGNDVTESMGKLCKHIWGYFPGWPAPADQWSKAVQMLWMAKSPTLLGGPTLNTVTFPLEYRISGCRWDADTGYRLLASGISHHVSPLSLLSKSATPS